MLQNYTIHIFIFKTVFKYSINNIKILSLYSNSNLCNKTLIFHIKKNVRRTKNFIVKIHSKIREKYIIEIIF